MCFVLYLFFSAFGLTVVKNERFWASGVSWSGYDFLIHTPNATAITTVDKRPEKMNKINKRGKKKIKLHHRKPRARYERDVSDKSCAGRKITTAKKKQTCIINACTVVYTMQARAIETCSYNNNSSNNILHTYIYPIKSGRNVI